MEVSSVLATPCYGQVNFNGCSKLMEHPEVSKTQEECEFLTFLIYTIVLGLKHTAEVYKAFLLC